MDLISYHQRDGYGLQYNRSLPPRLPSPPEYEEPGLGDEELRKYADLEKEAEKFFSAWNSILNKKSEELRTTLNDAVFQYQRLKELNPSAIFDTVPPAVVPRDVELRRDAVNEPTVLYKRKKAAERQRDEINRKLKTALSAKSRSFQGVKGDHGDTLLYRVQVHPESCEWSPQPHKKATNPSATKKHPLGYRSSGWDAFSPVANTDILNHMNKVMVGTPLISVSESPERLLRILGTTGDDHATAIEVFSLRMLQHLGVLQARSTDICDMRGIPRINGEDVPGAARWTTETHWVILHWIPDEALVATLSPREFRAVAKKSYITRADFPTVSLAPAQSQIQPAAPNDVSQIYERFGSLGLSSSPREVIDLTAESKTKTKFVAQEITVTISSNVAPVTPSTPRVSSQPVEISSPAVVPPSPSPNPVTNTNKSPSPQSQAANVTTSSVPILSPATVTKETTSSTPTVTGNTIPPKSPTPSTQPSSTTNPSPKPPPSVPPTEASKDTTTKSFFNTRYPVPEIPVVSAPPPKRTSAAKGDAPPASPGPAPNLREPFKSPPAPSSTKPTSLEEEFFASFMASKKAHRINVNGGLSGNVQASTTSGFNFGHPSTTRTAGSGGLLSSVSSGTTSGLNSGTAPTAGTGGGGLFGQKPATSTGGLFGQATTAPAGQGLFGQGLIPPNTTNSTSTGGLFGQASAAQSTGFGQKPAPTSGGLFGPTTAGATAFGQKPTAYKGGLFGQATTGTTAFGQAPATTQSTGFGQKPAASTGGLFGQTTGSTAFGQAPAATQSSGFGQKSTATTGGLFGGQVTAGATAFGQAYAAASAPSFGQKPPASTGGLFGQATAGTTAFGQAPAAQSTGFGQKPATVPWGQFGQSTAGATGAGLFGQAPKTTAAPFGQAPTTTSGAASFGQKPTASTGSLFGQAATGTTAFGQAPKSTAASFGQPSTTTTPGAALFGQKPAVTGGLFGQAPTSTTAFGQPPTVTAGAGSFGQATAATQSLGFGQKPAGTTSSGSFGQKPVPSTGRLFGEPAATTQSTGFGQAPTSTVAPFGQSTTATASTGSFGQAPAAGSGRLFGSAATGTKTPTPPAATGSLFGAPTTKPANAFGPPPPVSTGNLFGSAAAATGSTFGSAPDPKITRFFADAVAGTKTPTPTPATNASAGLFTIPGGEKKGENQGEKVDPACAQQ